MLTVIAGNSCIIETAKGGRTISCNEHNRDLWRQLVEIRL